MTLIRAQEGSSTSTNMYQSLVHRELSSAALCGETEGSTQNHYQPLNLTGMNNSGDSIYQKLTSLRSMQRLNK